MPARLSDRIVRLVILGSIACHLTAFSWGRSDSQERQGPSPEGAGSPPARIDREETHRGPELIREFFADWHDPFPADLDRSTLTAIWDEIDAMPTEQGIVGGDDSSGGEPGDRSARGNPTAWQPFGPFGMDTVAGGRFTGRIVDLALDDDGLYAAATASGGLWVRDANGWQGRSDAVTTLWSGSVDTHPTDSNTMLLGTGEPFIRSGTGLWKSTDGGESWSRRGMAPEPNTCFRLRYAANGNTVHGAFDLGYYQSTNGGETWTRRFHPGNWPTDLELHPTNPAVLFLTVYDQGLFRSTNGGAAWSEILGAGLPQTDIGRGAVTVCHSDPNRLYVAYARANGVMLGVFRSTDAGSTWTDVSPSEYMWGQGWYNNTIAVSPTDPDVVLAGGGGLHRTTDGGETWTDVSDPNLHVDYHASEWAANGQDVWVGHDGGFSHSTDAGATWSAMDNTMSITQYVTIGASATESPFVMGGGSQDNGISLTTDGGATWFFRHGGDGGGLAINPDDSNLMYSTAGIYGGVWPFRRLRSSDRGVTWQFMDGGIGLATQWWIRIRTDLGSPHNLYTYGNGFVYKSIAGTAWTAMNGNPTVFPHHVSELTASHFAEPAGTVYACLDSNIDGERLRVWDGAAFQERSAGLPSGVRVRKVPTHPRKPDWAFAIMNGLGNPGQKVFRTTNRGLTWTNVTGNLPDVPVSDLIAHPTDDARLYLSSEMGCFRSTNGGGAWERWQLGLPEAAIVTEMTFVDRLDVDGSFSIVAGTYGRGMWVRDIDTDDTSGVPPPDGDGQNGEDDARGGLRDLLSPTLDRAAPNPFRDATSIGFTLRREGNVVLRILDVEGREMVRMLEGLRSTGYHRLSLAGARLSPGVYFVRLETADGTAEGKITRIE